MADNKPPKHQEDEGLPDWFATFADMMTLLMTFFVLLFSMSTLDPVKMADLAASMEKNLIGSKRPKIPIKTQSQIKREVQETISKMNMSDVASVSSSPKGTTITIDSRYAFSIGSADLTPRIYPFLDSIIPIMKDKGNRYPIAVEGHTDNVPVSGAIAERYPSNWELSGARAASVVRYFIDRQVPAGKLRAVGYAAQIPAGTTWSETRIGVTDERVLEGNSTVEKKAANRRVEITFRAIG